MAESVETTADAKPKLRWFQFGLSTLFWLTAICAIISAVGAYWWRKSRPVYRTISKVEEKILRQESLGMDGFSVTIARRPKKPGMYLLETGGVVGHMGEKLVCSGTSADKSQRVNVVLPAVKNSYWTVIFVKRDDGELDYFAVKFTKTSNAADEEPPASASQDKD